MLGLCLAGASTRKHALVFTINSENGVIIHNGIEILEVGGLVCEAVGMSKSTHSLMN